MHPSTQRRTPGLTGAHAGPAADVRGVLRRVLKAVLGSSRKRTVIWAVLAAGLLITHFAHGSSPPSRLRSPALDVGVQAPADFVAASPGVLPADGTSSVAGVGLPPGHRSPKGDPFWISYSPDPHADAIAERLAQLFPRTGLWPLLWDARTYSAAIAPFGFEASGPSAVGEIDAGRALADAWSTEDPSPFPGLAAGTPHLGPFNPFVLFDSSTWYGDPQPRYKLLLVSCRRPADALAELGVWWLGGRLHAVELSAVLRSWAARFDAQFVGEAAGQLVVTTPFAPRTATSARRLAAELVAATDDSERAIPDIVRALTVTGPFFNDGRVFAWAHGWALG